jgi:signal transduction histidine kinase
MADDSIESLALEVRREGALQSVTAGLSSAATRDEILRAILEEGTRVLAASAAVAYVLLSDRRTLVLTAHEHIGDDVARVAAGLSIDSAFPVARSMREGAPVWVSSGDELDAAFPELAAAMRGRVECRAVAALPLRARGEIVADIGFAFPSEHGFDDAERAFLRTLAERCESAMERARLYEESQAARAAAERSRAESEAQLRFNEIVAGILAHDLKNPLSAVVMNARLLRNAEGARERTIGARIATSSERMARMIDQILDWTRFRSSPGQFQLTRRSCDLGAIADEVVAELRARRADAPIVVETRGSLSGSWDADRLAQVLSNLVGNGLDHASRPGVSLFLDGSGDPVRVTVQNEGKVDDELLPVIFEPFRGRASGARDRGRGLGLGLFITRQLVLAHGGRIHVERAGARVAFTAELPRGPAA